MVKYVFGRMENWDLASTYKAHMSSLHSERVGLFFGCTVFVAELAIFVTLVLQIKWLVW